MDFENNIKINCNKIQPEFSNVVRLNNEHYECDQQEQILQEQQQQQQQNKLEQQHMIIQQQQQQAEENRANEQEQQEQYVMPNKTQKSYKHKQQKQYDEQQPMLKKSLHQNISKDQRRKSPTQQQQQQQNEQQKTRRSKQHDGIVLPAEQNVENSLHLNNNHENNNNNISSNTRSKSMAWTNSNNKKQTTTVAITATPMNQYHNNNNNSKQINTQQLVEQQIQCNRTTKIENGCLSTCATTAATATATITTASGNDATATLTTTTTTTMTTIVTTSSASTSAVPKQIAAAINETTTTATKTTTNVNNNKNNNNIAQRVVSNQSTTNAKQQTIAAAQKKPTANKEAATITTKDIATATTALITTTNVSNNNNNKATTTETNAISTTTTTTTTTAPLLSLAPPVSSTTTPTTASWASLFNNETNVTNNLNNNYAATTKTINNNQINAINSNNSNTNNTNNNTNNNNNNKNAESSTTNMLQENSSTKKFIIKVKRCDNLITNNNVTPISPIITPGAMSYAATSARGLANANAAAAKVIKTDTPVTISKTVQTVTQKVKLPKRPEQIDEWTHKYGDFLNKFKTDLQAISLRPRGLTNRSNYCYINCILQALIGCPPFYNLLKSIPKQAAVLSDVKTPTVNAMMQFVNNFALLRGNGIGPLRTHNRKSNKDDINNDLQSDPAFEPTDIYKLWNEGRAEHAEGRQEDAEEFLGYVLNQLNDEMMEVINLIGSKSNGAQNGQKYQTAAEDGDDWQMICNNRNKVSFTRQTDFGRTPLSDIFRGELRSRLQREGEHPTDVVQPFFTLQLNIERAASVKEALEILVGRDQVEGVTGSKSKQEVQAWQQTTLEKLPIVLIMHLKWFDYRSDGCTKILKKVEIPVELKIDAKIMASKKYSPKQRSYRLFAVVYHDGQEATKGHYITDVYHTGYESWLRYDDNYVKPVSEHHVLSPTSPRVPYLLFYRRCDSLLTVVM